MIDEKFFEYETEWKLDMRTIRIVSNGEVEVVQQMKILTDKGLLVCTPERQDIAEYIIRIHNEALAAKRETLYVPPPRRPGRPTKKEQEARARALWHQQSLQAKNSEGQNEVQSQEETSK